MCKAVCKATLWNVGTATTVFLILGDVQLQNCIMHIVLSEPLSQKCLEAGPCTVYPLAWIYPEAVRCTTKGFSVLVPVKQWRLRVQGDYVPSAVEAGSID